MKHRSKADTFLEDYWINSSEYRSDFVGIRIHSFCHSFLFPRWHSNGQSGPFIMASIILSGEEERIFLDGDRIRNYPGFFQICDLNDSRRITINKQKKILERYFVLFRVNHLLRGILNELFQSDLPRFMPRYPARLKKCFEDIRHILRKQGTTDDYLLGAMGFRLLTEAASQMPSERQIPEALASALRYIDSQFSNPMLDRTQIASAAGISVVLLGKLFQSCIKTTVCDYITSLRLEKAKHLLSFSTLPIAMIAEKCGFSYAYYFAKVFRDHVGQAPINYRFLHQKKRIDSDIPRVP